MTAPTIRDVRTQSRELKLDATPHAAGAARRFVTDVLREWSIADSSIEAAELVTSELTTNAVLYTGCAVICAARQWCSDLFPAVWVRVYLHDQDVIVEVWDRSVHPPVIQKESSEAEGGRGLLLVASLSAQWGYYWPPAGGKVVWAEVGVLGDEKPSDTTGSTTNTGYVLKELG